jgi:hypothetical protein
MLSGCAVSAQQAGERVVISTNPPGAYCRLDRVGVHLADLPATPGYVVIDAAAADLLITCAKPGYQTMTLSQPAHALRPRTGNVVVSRFAGAIIDGVSGGIYEYPGEIALDLQPRSAGGNAVPY